MYEFDRDRYVTPAGSGSFQGNVSPLWNVGPVPNGGYVLSLAMAALEQTFAGLDPLTVTAHFLRPTAPGPIEAAVETIKRGRNFSTAMVALRQDGKESVRVLATYGRLDAVEAEREFVDGTPPAVARDDCLLWNRPKGMAPEIANRFESRIASEDAKRMQTGDADRAEVRGWIRFVDGRAADVHCLGLIADAFPPPVFMVTERGWVPTIELTVHVRARPTSDWLNCIFRTRFLFGGLLEEDGEIWDASGRLVALSRQLAGRPRTT